MSKNCCCLSSDKGESWDHIAAVKMLEAEGGRGGILFPDSAEHEEG